jgi:hypothetical protein
MRDVARRATKLLAADLAALFSGQFLLGISHSLQELELLGLHGDVGLLDLNARLQLAQGLGVLGLADLLLELIKLLEPLHGAVIAVLADQLVGRRRVGAARDDRGALSAKEPVNFSASKIPCSEPEIPE